MRPVAVLPIADRRHFDQTTTLTLAAQVAGGSDKAWHICLYNYSSRVDDCSRIGSLTSAGEPRIHGHLFQSEPFDNEQSTLDPGCIFWGRTLVLEDVPGHPQTRLLGLISGHRWPKEACHMS